MKIIKTITVRVFKKTTIILEKIKNQQQLEQLKKKYYSFWNELKQLQLGQLRKLVWGENKTLTVRASI